MKQICFCCRQVKSSSLKPQQVDGASVIHDVLENSQSNRRRRPCDEATYCCPNCCGNGMRVFYQVDQVPVHSCLLFDSRETAVDCPRRSLSLGICETCGFISNVVFDPDVHESSDGYEDQQSFSPRFQRYQSGLIDRLTDQYDIRGKHIVEIGCGKGDFLLSLCDAGRNAGVGIDPRCEGTSSDGTGRVRFIAERFSVEHSGLPCDLFCCLHTLEHIHSTNEFVGLLRRVIGARAHILVFLQVPDVGRILRERAFWDIYYEHCSYFSASALAHMLQLNGFEIIERGKEFGGQYLSFLARPVDAVTLRSSLEENDSEQMMSDVDSFTIAVKEQVKSWRSRITAFHNAGKSVAIWGAGSKCVAFLSTLGVERCVDIVVDINPRRQGKFLPGSVKRIVAPDFLLGHRPEVILVMNPIYHQEIQQQILEMGITAELISV